MARPKKNGTYLNVCIETSLYRRIESLCKEAGQTKTVAVERALLAYLEEYETTEYSGHIEPSNPRVRAAR